MASAPSSPASGPPGGPVLVVDDDPDIGLVLGRVFQRAGLRTAWAPDGASALRLAAESEVTLVVLDLGLPDIDGLDLLPQLRRLTSAPVVLLSARARDEDRLAGLRQGADDYVTKPFDNLDLVARCQALLSTAAAGRAPVRRAEAG